MKMIRRLFALTLVLCLMMPLPMLARADMWMPPDEEYCHGVLSMCYEDDVCGGINTFLSNYVEANVLSYDASASNESVMAKVLKHLELNASLFPDDITKFVGEDGRVYMRVSQELFERRMQILFDRYIDASVHAGYMNEEVIVSASHFGGPIRVFASAYRVDYLGDRTYWVGFEVYKAPGSVNSYYTVCNRNLDTSQLESLGTGTATIRYGGDNEATNFKSTSFKLLKFSMDAENIPCTTPNVPYTHTVEPEHQTQPPTTATQSAETQPPVTETPATELLATEAAEETEPAVREENKPSNDYQMIIVVLLVIAIALMALIVILLLFKKR